MPTEDPETEIVAASRISCDGGGTALGHPRVWLSIDPREGLVECGYCDKRFILKGGPADPASSASKGPPSEGTRVAMPPAGDAEGRG